MRRRSQPSICYRGARWDLFKEECEAHLKAPNEGSNDRAHLTAS